VLAELTAQPPGETIAMIEPSTAEPGSSYSVVFRPYGYGPRGSAGAQLVIVVVESQPAKGVSRPFAFAGRNVMAILSPSESPVTQGGTYRGTLKLVLQGGLLLPQMSQIER
jgi:hypothetical protein